MSLYAQTFFGISLDFTNIQHSKNIYQRLRICFLFSVLNQISIQLLSNFQSQKPSNYKQIWRLRPDPSCVCKKCTFIIKFSHTICHFELTSISKTITLLVKVQIISEEAIISIFLIFWYLIYQHFGNWFSVALWM